MERERLRAVARERTHHAANCDEDTRRLCPACIEQAAAFNAIRDALNLTMDYLSESHGGELSSSHHGDEPADGGRCSYCSAIKAAQAALAWADKVSR